MERVRSPLTNRVLTLKCEDNPEHTAALASIEEEWLESSAQTSMMYSAWMSIY